MGSGATRHEARYKPFYLKHWPQLLRIKFQALTALSSVNDASSYNNIDVVLFFSFVSLHLYLPFLLIYVDSILLRQVKWNLRVTKILFLLIFLQFCCFNVFSLPLYQLLSFLYKCVLLDICKTTYIDIYVD